MRIIFLLQNCKSVSFGVFNKKKIPKSHKYYRMKKIIFFLISKAHKNYNLDYFNILIR